MPLNSVQTNTGAATALRALSGAASELATTQRRLATGLRVGSVRDNGAVWAVAQSQRGEILALGAITTGLRRSESIVDVAIASGEAIADLLAQMKEKALSASDEGLSSASRAMLDQDFRGLRDQVTRVVEAAQFDGANLIDYDAEEFQVLAGLGSTVQTINEPPRTLKNGKVKAGKSGTFVIRSTITVVPEYLYLGGPQVTVGSGAALTNAAASKVLVGEISTSIINVGQSLSRLGSSSRQLARQQDFLAKVRDGLTKGVGDLVDADIGKETARLRAMETRQQLNLQSLSIANDAPKVLLGLFRS